MAKLLESIHSPEDLKKLPLDKLPELAREMREVIMQTVSTNGGHLAPNLGTVEIAIALNVVFSFPKDRMLWDVGHQCYPHKLLTGRYKNFKSLRKAGGLSGFPSPSESPYDLFYVGHAGTAISTAVGMARGDYLQNKDTKIVALVGDASIVNGLSFEGINGAGTLKRQMLIILNDNSMSISEPQGAFANYLEHLRISHSYDDLKKKVQDLLNQVPYGQRISEVANNVKQGIRNTIAPGHIFEDFGMKYFGPVDGHDLPSLIEKLNELRDLNVPAVLHVKTIKGKGYEWACEDPTTFHSTKPFMVDGDRVTIEKGTGRSWTSAFADAMVSLAKKNEKVIGITAAMPDGTGMIKLKPTFPNRYFDTGICESHAVAMAAGMQKAGIKPVVAIYSTFLQRAFDQVFQEVCLQNLPVVFCCDRAGLVGDDGAVHHGFCDLSFLRSQPNMVLMSPSDEQDLVGALNFAVTLDCPCQLRYPRDNCPAKPLGEQVAWEITATGGRSRTLREGADATIVAYGSLAMQSLQAADALANEGLSVGVVDARFCKPVDGAMLDKLFAAGKPIITVEDHAVIGGFGAAVIEYAQLKRHDARLVTRLGLPDRFIAHASRGQQLKEVGLDPVGIASSVRAAIAEQSNEVHVVEPAVKRVALR